MSGDESDHGYFGALLILAKAVVKLGADGVQLADEFQAAAQLARDDGNSDKAITLELLAGSADPGRYKTVKPALKLVPTGKDDH